MGAMTHGRFIFERLRKGAMARVGILETDARTTPTITARLATILGIYRYLRVWDAPKSTARAATLDDRPFPSSLTSIPHPTRAFREVFEIELRNAMAMRPARDRHA